MHEPDDGRSVGPRGEVSSPVWQTFAAAVALALVVYLPAALGAGFLGFDDVFFFGPHNPEFRDGLAAVFDPSRPIANAFLPVAHASLWLDWWLAGGKPFWPHLHALLLHGIAAAVLVRLLLALRVDRGVAFVVGALFVVHPALAESVAWVSGRKDVLSGLFTFTGLLLTARFCRRPGAPLAVGIAVCTALAMYSKATAIVLPLLAVLVCLRTGGPRSRLLAPAISLLVALPIAWHHQTIAAAEGTLAAGSTVERLAQVPGAYLHYATTTLWPLHLNVLYPEVDTLRAFRAAVVPGAIVLVGLLLVIAAAAKWPRARVVALGVAAFAVALLPFNTAYPGSSIAAADRYLYLAIPGAALALVEAMRRILGQRGPWFATGLVLPLAWLAGSRAHDFGNDETLWRSSISEAPENAVARVNLAIDLRSRGRIEVAPYRENLEAAVRAARYPIHELRAQELLRELALREANYQAAAAAARGAIAAATAQLAAETSDKRRTEARTLLLEAHLAAFEPLLLAGEAEAAEASWQAANALVPRHPAVVAFAAMRDLAAVGKELQKSRESGGPSWLRDDDPRGASADRMLAEALAENPSHPALLTAQAAWDRARDRVLPALRNYRLALAADETCIDAWLGISRLLRDREQYAEAESYARQGLQKLGRPDPALRQEFGLALAGQGKLDDAIAILEAYMRVRPTDRDTGKVLANLLIGTAYGKLGDRGAKPEDVYRIVERALAYNPDEVKAHLVLGRLYRQQRQLKEALHHLEIAYRTLPDFEDARRFYAECLADIGYERVLKKDDDGAAVAWLRCLAVAPEDLDTSGIRTQVAALWRRIEARGVERAQSGDRAGAIADFRRCLELDPEQHWPAWLLATVLQQDPAADLAELEALCRKAVAWQRRHGLDAAEQTLLLATALLRAGRDDDARATAGEYLRSPSADAKPHVVQALRRLAGD